MTVTSKRHAQAERAKKEKREKNAASMGGADRDPGPEDGAQAQWMQPSLLFSISLLFLLVRVALKLRSLRFHSPRLCRIAVFLIQTNVSLIIFCFRSSYVSLHLGEHELSPLLRPLHLCDSVCSYLYDSLLLSLPATTRVGRSGSNGYCSLGFASST